LIHKFLFVNGTNNIPLVRLFVELLICMVAIRDKIFNVGRKLNRITKAEGCDARNDE
jgi:hypothetical protein